MAQSSYDYCCFAYGSWLYSFDKKQILLDLASIALYEIAWIQNIDRTDIVVLTGQ
jgi:hypothetical protein